MSGLPEWYDDTDLLTLREFLRDWVGLDDVIHLETRDGSYATGAFAGTLPEGVRLRGVTVSWDTVRRVQVVERAEKLPTEPGLYALRKSAKSSAAIVLRQHAEGHWDSNDLLDDHTAKELAERWASEGNLVRLVAEDV